MSLKAEWQKVFKYVAAVAKDSCKKNASLTYPQAMKKAWKDPRVLAKRKEYEKKKAAKSKTKVAVKAVARPAKAATPAKRVVKKVNKKVTKKVTKKVVTKK